MSALLVLAGLILLVLPGQRWLPSHGLVPSEWVRATAGAMRLGQATVMLGLFLGAAPTVLRTAGIEHAAEVCHRMFGPVAPGGAPVGWISAVALVWLIARRQLALRQHRRSLHQLRIEPWLGDHELIDGIEVITLATDQPLAYAIPGSPSQVVLSDSLRASLTATELAAVIAHERSHLVNRHDRFSALASVHEGCFGRWATARRSAAGLRLAVERWADEDAAPSISERGAVRAALVKTTASMLGPSLAFTGGCTVVDRIAALDAGPPRPLASTRLAALSPLGATTALIVVGLATWSTYTHHGLLGLVGFCPI